MNHLNPKVSWTILIVFAVIALGAVGYFSYKYYQEASKSTPIVTSSTTTPVETTDWKTYTNSTFNFTMKYPTDWAVKDNLQTDLAKESNIGQSLVIYKNNGQQTYPYLETYVNASGWGPSTAAVRYDISYTDGKMLVTNRQTVNSSGTGDPVVGMISFWNGSGSNITIDNLHYYYAAHNATDRADENTIINILSTFKPTTTDETAGNIFDLLTAKTGDKVATMTIVSIKPYSMTTTPPKEGDLSASNAKVVFSGQATIEGTCNYNYSDMFGGYMLSFQVSGDALNNLPAIKGSDSNSGRLVWFSNNEQAMQMLGITENEAKSGNATIAIQDYVMNRYPTEVLDTFTLVSVQ